MRNKIKNNWIKLYSMTKELTLFFKHFSTLGIIIILCFNVLQAEDYRDQPPLVQMLISSSHMGTTSSQWSTDVSTGNNDENEEEAQIRQFIASNYDIIEQEIVTGKGERLNTLAFLYGCPVEINETFGKIAKKNYEKLYVNIEQNNEIKLSKNIKISLSLDSQLKNKCSMI